MPVLVNLNGIDYTDRNRVQTIINLGVAQGDFEYEHPELVKPQFMVGRRKFADLLLVRAACYHDDKPEREKSIRYALVLYPDLPLFREYDLDFTLLHIPSILIGEQDYLIVSRVSLSCYLDEDYHYKLNRQLDALRQS